MKNTHLGKQAEDKITGFIGTVTAFCEYLTGCDRYLLNPKTDDPTKKPEAHWFDSSQLTFTDDVVVEIEVEKGNEGAGMEAPKY